jgi:hypothetical protein
MNVVVDPTPDPLVAEPLVYAYKPSLVGSPRLFTLTEDKLVFQSGMRAGAWRYDEIARIRLSYRPVSMQARRFRADIDHRNSGRLVVISSTWTGIVTLAPQDDAYRAFVSELHRRLVRGGAQVEYVAGLRPAVYTLGALAIAAVGLALAGLFVRAVASGSASGALFMAGFAALFAWQIGGWLLRNRPGSYTPDRLPPSLMP